MRLGDLSVCGLTKTSDLNNLTVRQVLAELQLVLAGVPTADTYFDLDELARELNAAFLFGEPTTWAQAHAFNGAYP